MTARCGHEACGRAAKTMTPRVPRWLPVLFAGVFFGGVAGLAVRTFTDHGPGRVAGALAAALLLGWAVRGAR